MASIQIFKPFRPLALMDVAQEAPGLIAITPATWAAPHTGHWPDAHLHYNEEAWNEKVGLRPQGDVLAPQWRQGNCGDFPSNGGTRALAERSIGTTGVIRCAGSGWSPCRQLPCNNGLYSGNACDKLKAAGKSTACKPTAVVNEP